MGDIYLDNSATTAICPAAHDRMNEVYRELWGNPSSVHGMGISSARVLADSRKTVASALGVRFGAGEIVFCSSGTEADNLAVFGVAHAKKRLAGGRIIISDSEHPAVSRAADRLGEEGFDIVRVPTRSGVLDLDFLEDAMTDKTLLVSLMSVNNETGAAYDVAAAFARAKRKNPNVITHTDAVQGFLKMPGQLVATGADLITVSSHKVHGPKGIGALYISAPLIRSKSIAPVTYGGGQENGLRSGTENLPGIAGFAAAVADGVENIDASLSSMRSCREHFEKRISEDPGLSGVLVNRPTGQFVPHIISIAVPGIRSEVMLRFLSGEGIYVSSGSACSSKAKSPSPTLLAFGLDSRTADSTLRISLSRYTTTEDMDRLADVLAAGIKRLARTTK